MRGGEGDEEQQVDDGQLSNEEETDDLDEADEQHSKAKEESFFQGESWLDTFYHAGRDPTTKHKIASSQRHSL
jgi:hypothetical protein